MNQEIKSQIKQCSELYDMNSIYLQATFSVKNEQSFCLELPEQKIFLSQKGKNKQILYVELKALTLSWLTKPIFSVQTLP